MTRTPQSEQRIKLKRSEKIFTGLGMTMVVVSLSIWILTEALAPDFTKPTWYIASPGLTLLTLLVGLYLVLRGTKRLINSAVSRLDMALECFIVYRAVRWLILNIIFVTLTIIAFILEGTFGNSSSSGKSKDSILNKPTTPKPEGSEAIWDVGSDHHYDNKPPPPFS